MFLKTGLTMIMTLLFEKNLPIAKPALQNGLFLQRR
jgi:hypothetical protein